MSDDTDPTPSNDATEPDYVRRRIAVGGAALAAVLAVVALVVVARGDTDTVSISLPSTSSTTTTTTTTTLPPTTTSTTTSTTTTTTSTTTTTTEPPPPTTILVDGVPVWEPYEPLPPLDGIAALTGRPAGADVSARPIIAAKIDNFARARPQWALDQADVIIEENVEGVTRFVALFHTSLPDRIGPVRSARTGDLDILASMNRPVLVWSGGNAGVTRWIESAASAGVLVDFTAQRNPCYNRNSSRRAPHNLQLDPACATGSAPTAGPARSLWSFDPDYQVPADAGAAPQGAFRIEMDGVTVDWTWDAASGTYLRSQNGGAHVAISGNRVAMNNVVELDVFHAPSPVDARSPNPITVGEGTARIHRNGITIPATWQRESAYDPFTFLDGAGRPIPLNLGTTFVELVRDRPR